MPSFTFSASAHAVAWNGAYAAVRRVRTVDVSTRLSTTPQPRCGGVAAILATHVFGAPCVAEAVEALGEAHGVPLVFDAAHAFGARADGVPRRSVRRRRGVQPHADEAARRGRGRTRRDHPRRRRLASAHRARLREPGQLRHAVRRAERAHVGDARGDGARVARRFRREPVATLRDRRSVLQSGSRDIPGVSSADDRARRSLDVEGLHDRGRPRRVRRRSRRACDVRSRPTASTRGRTSIRRSIANTRTATSTSDVLSGHRRRRCVGCSACPSYPGTRRSRSSTASSISSPGCTTNRMIWTGRRA